MAAFETYAGRGIRRQIRPYFQKNEVTKAIYAIITWWGTQIAMNFAVTPFVLMEVRKVWVFYKSWYFIVPIVSVILALALQGESKKPTKKGESAQDSEKKKSSWSISSKAKNHKQWSCIDVRVVCFCQVSSFFLSLSILPSCFCCTLWYLLVLRLRFHSSFSVWYILIESSKQKTLLINGQTDSSGIGLKVFYRTSCQMCACVQKEKEIVRAWIKGCPFYFLSFSLLSHIEGRSERSVYRRWRIGEEREKEFFNLRNNTIHCQQSAKDWIRCVHISPQRSSSSIRWKWQLEYWNPNYLIIEVLLT